MKDGNKWNGKKYKPEKIPKNETEVSMGTRPRGKKPNRSPYKSNA